MHLAAVKSYISVRRSKLLAAQPLTAAFRCQGVPHSTARINWEGSRVASNTSPASCDIEHPAQASIRQLALQHGVNLGYVDILRSSDGGLGLLASRDIQAGQTVISVPRSLSLVIDYENGISLPSGDWPRLRGGVALPETLTWDLLLALAIMDALAGEGDALWQAYADAVLPAPEAITLPFCWGESMLEELQHIDIQDAALRQQERLLKLFPDLMEPLAPGVPSWLQWAFACVRSRSFRAGKEAFAMVPFLDLANHGTEANADMRVLHAAIPAAFSAANSNSSSTGSSTGASTTGAAPAPAAAAFELYAVRDIAAGEEVCMSYTGQEGYTNQRLMAQYGFVLRDGNAADRLVLQPFEPSSITTTAQSSRAAEGGAGPSAQPFSSSSGVLNLERMQNVMGDAMFKAMLQGNSPRIFAALKSLPLADDALENAPVGVAAGAAAAADGRGGVDMAAAQHYLSQCEAELASSRTTPQEDEEMLQAAASNPDDGAFDPRIVSAIVYRLERKRLLETCQLLLNLYLKA